MSDRELAEAYAKAFPNDRNLWSEKSFAAFRADKFAQLFEKEGAALLLRLIGDEAEILTLFVTPDKRRQGYAQALLQEALDFASKQGIRHIYLEVAQDNHGARALYGKMGFGLAGRRKSYYQRKDGSRVDALNLTLFL